uniref:Uncharacterized protein n=1 Tax=Anguilla anguilla TaxID=7936 RepID=A0A0E9V955_ANGAN
MYSYNFCFASSLCTVCLNFTYLSIIYLFIYLFIYLSIYVNTI